MPDYLVCLKQIAAKINIIIRETGLKDVGQLQQDLVFGDAGTKDVIKFLKERTVRKCYATKEKNC